MFSLLEAQLEEKFVKVLTIGHGFKKYLQDQEINKDRELDIDQAIMILSKIIQISKIQLAASRCILHVRKNSKNSQEKILKKIDYLCDALKDVLTTYCQLYEKKAVETIAKYIELQLNKPASLAYQSRLKTSRMVNEEQMLKDLRDPNITELNKYFVIRHNGKQAISKLIKEIRERRDFWFRSVASTKLLFERIDNQVKKNVRDHAQEQFKQITKQHQSYLKWLSLFETAMKRAEANTKEIYQKLDDDANHGKKLGGLMLRAGLTAAVPPVISKLFIDPTIMIFNQVIEKIERVKGNISLEIAESQALWVLTGLRPDPLTNRYTKAYEQLASETDYDKIERLKKYLTRKIDALSKTAQLTDIMSNDSKMWGNGKFTADHIVSAQRMRLIDEEAYSESKEWYEPEKKAEILTKHLTASFIKTIDEIFEPLKAQYGASESWTVIHDLIDKIQFNSHHPGENSHNQYLDNSLIDSLSIHIEIYFLVKYLRENSFYVGGDLSNITLYRSKHNTYGTDFKFGLHPDDKQTKQLIIILLRKIMKTDNTRLKEHLGLHKLTDQSDSLLEHPLVSEATASKPRAATDSLYKAYSNFCGKSPEHLARQEMLQIIIESYYNLDLGLLLQEQLLIFAKNFSIKLPISVADLPAETLLPVSKWLSDDELSNLIAEKTKKFVEDAQEKKNKDHEDVRNIRLLFRYKSIRDQAEHLRKKEITMNEIENSKPKFNI